MVIRRLQRHATVGRVILGRRQAEILIWLEIKHHMYVIRLLLLSIVHRTPETSYATAMTMWSRVTLRMYHSKDSFSGDDGGRPVQTVSSRAKRPTRVLQSRFDRPRFQPRNTNTCGTFRFDEQVLYHHRVYDVAYHGIGSTSRNR